jgi:hypothetical protein
MSLLNINDHFTSGKGDAESKLTLAANTGANMWRASIPWASVEKSKGQFAMPADVITVMDKTKELDMQALIILAYGNEDVYGTTDPDDPTWVAAYANYCYEVAKYMAENYPGQVVGFEIWNEWNNESMSKVSAKEDRTGTKYAEVVKAASAEIKAVNAQYTTSFQVIAGATAGDGYLKEGETPSNSYEFMYAFFAVDGIFDYFDGFSFHTYSSKETTTDADKIEGKRMFEYVSPTEHNFVSRFEDVYKRLNGAKKEIWVTETGWTTNAYTQVVPKKYSSDKKYAHHTDGATEEEQAAYMVQLYAQTMAKQAFIDRIFWYDLMNDIAEDVLASGEWRTDRTESNYGLIHNWKNSDGQPLAYSAKPGYVAMCAMSSMLAKVTYSQAFTLGDGISAYQFQKKDGTYITVAWTPGDTVERTLTGTMTVTDLYGNASKSNTVTLSEAPIYIESTSSENPFN